MAFLNIGIQRGSRIFRVEIFFKDNLKDFHEGLLLLVGFLIWEVEINTWKVRSMGSKWHFLQKIAELWRLFSGCLLTNTDELSIFFVESLYINIGMG